LAPTTSQTSRPHTLAAFDFPNGSLLSTEAGAKRRASLHVLRGEEELRSIDPRLLSGIGNAYSDEILHSAQLSPTTLTHKLKPEEWERLYSATQQTLQLWIDRLQTEAKASFPERVTAFREGMAVHGRYNKPAPAAAKKSNASATPTTKPTTAPAAKPPTNSSPTAPSPVFSAPTGPEPSTNWNP
jgi:formamidopyrimidine-DNA glycosylase